MAALYALVGAELLPASFDFNCAETVVFGTPYASSLATTLALSWVSLKISVQATHVSTNPKRPGRSIVFGLDWLELALEQPDPLPAFEAAGLLRHVWTLRSILSCSNVDPLSLAVMASSDLFYLMAGHGILQSFPCATEENCRGALVEHFLFGICDALRGNSCRFVRFLRIRWYTHFFQTFGRNGVADADVGCTFELLVAPAMCTRLRFGARQTCPLVFSWASS